MSRTDVPHFPSSVPANAVNAIECIAKSRMPGLWEKCYPRAYDDLGKFHSPRIAAAALANAVMSATLNGLTGSGVRNQFIVACQVDLHQVPTFFIGTDFLRACDRTSLPPDMKWTDIKMPHPGMVFMFERGAVKRPGGGDAAFAAIARIESGQRVSHSLVPGGGAPPAGAMLMLTADHEASEFYQYDLSVSESTGSILVNDLTHAGVDNSDRDDGGLSVPMTASEATFNQWITGLCLKVILAMHARPELVSAGTIIRTVKPKRPNEAGKQFWSPNIVGRNYRLIHDGAVGEAGGRKVRAHWRRGHFRQQAHGIGWGQRKTLWIEPILVGEIA